MPTLFHLQCEVITAIIAGMIGGPFNASIDRNHMEHPSFILLVDSMNMFSYAYVLTFVIFKNS